MSVSVYPVPFSDEATVKITTGQNLSGSVFVMYDETGREVNRINIPAAMQFSIHSGSLADGMYLYQIINNGQTVYNGKLMIER